MQLSSTTLLGPLGSGVAKTRLSFIFGHYDRGIVGLTSSYLLPGITRDSVELESDGTRVGIADCINYRGRNGELGVADCGAVFDVDPSCEISEWFARGSNRPLIGMASMLGKQVSLSVEGTPHVGTILPNYDEAELTIYGKTEAIFPLLAVSPRDLATLVSRYGLLNGAMLLGDEDSLCGIIVGLSAAGILLVAPIWPILEKHHLSMLSPEAVMRWNSEVRYLRKHSTGSKRRVIRQAAPPIPPTNSALSQLERSI